MRSEAAALIGWARRSLQAEVLGFTFGRDVLFFREALTTLPAVERGRGGQSLESKDTKVRDNGFYRWVERPGKFRLPSYEEQSFVSLAFMLLGCLAANSPSGSRSARTKSDEFSLNYLNSTLYPVTHFPNTRWKSPGQL